MGLVSSYNNDIFHEQLQNFIDVHVGRRTKVWRDKRLTPIEVFSDEIEQQLRSSAILVSIISPGYMKSEWCNRELVGFTRVAQERGNLRVGNLQRVVKSSADRLKEALCRLPRQSTRSGVLSR